MADPRFRVVIVDRPTWYVPSIERQVLSEIGADVIVGWAATKDAPPEAKSGYPKDTPVEEYSQVTSYAVPVSIGTEQRLIEMARDADGVILMAASMNATVMDALPNLKVIGRYGIGTDSIDVDAATARGIAVTYAPAFCAREVADQALAYILFLGRRMDYLNGLMHRGVWGRAQASPMAALYCRTLGIVGLGNIGRLVARRAAAFGLKLLAADPYVDQSTIESFGAEKVELDELLSTSDFVSLHCPLGKETRHLISERELRLMKPSAYLISTSRGPVVDEPALIQALQEHWIAGAGIDVYEREPLDPASPLVKLDNVLLTPHSAAISDQAGKESKRRTARGVAAILAGRWPDGVDLRNPEVKTVPNLRVKIPV